MILCTAVLLEQRSLLLAKFKYKQRFLLNMFGILRFSFSNIITSPK